MAKVIHVHIFSRPRGERKDYYFSSITAVYSVLTAEDIGARKSYLLHCGLSGGGSIITKKAIIKQSAKRRWSNPKKLHLQMKLDVYDNACCQFIKNWGLCSDFGSVASSGHHL